MSRPPTKTDSGRRTVGGAARGGELDARKRALRQAMSCRRRALSPHRREVLSAQVVRAVVSHAAFLHARCVALFEPLHAEVDISSLRDIAASQGKSIYLPRVGPMRSLIFLEVAPDTELTRGPFGVWEPPLGLPVATRGMIDLAVVPGLAFDLCGGRLGYGGGYYDRWFTAEGEGAFRLGVLFDFQRVDRVPVDDEDILMHAIISDAGAWRCG